VRDTEIPKTAEQRLVRRWARVTSREGETPIRPVWLAAFTFQARMRGRSPRTGWLGLACLGSDGKPQSKSRMSAGCSAIRKGASGGPPHATPWRVLVTGQFALEACRVSPPVIANQIARQFANYALTSLVGDRGMLRPTRWSATGSDWGAIIGRRRMRRPSSRISVHIY
jgi:hypothetical protein